MPHKGFRYAYPIASASQSQLGKEIDIIGTAFQDAGWKEVEIVPDAGFPTHIIFEWQQNRMPIYPRISFP